jgi:uncharacterized repeat protein (TIGR02543 family)
MKMLKTNLFNNIFKAASLLVCAALVACSGVNGVSDRDESSSSNNGRAYLSSISFGNGRTILPNSSFDLATSIDRFVLRGTALDAEEPAEVELGTWDSSDAGSAYTLMLADISRNTIELTTGSWNFAVTAFVKSGENYVPVLQKSIEEQQVRSGGNRLNFGTLSEANGNGVLKVLLEYPINTGLYTVTKVTAALEPLDGTNWRSAEGGPLTQNTVDSNFKSVTYEIEPANGNYILTFKFYMSGDGKNFTQTYTEYVRIATGLESTAIRRVSDLMSLYSITYYDIGGTLPGTLQGKYSPYDGDVLLATSPVVSKKGATFAGWYESNNYSGSKLVKIAAGSTGSKILYAKWGYEMNTTTKTISANGASLIVQKEGSATRIYFDEDQDGVADEDEVILDDNGNPIDFTGWTVYGGSQGGNYSGDTSVTVNDGNLAAVYGGNGSGSVSNTNVEINGGTIGTVYGGNKAGTVNGDTVVEINGGTVGKVIGGSQSGTTEGDSVINISGGSVTEVSGNKDKVTGDSSVNISGDPIIGSPSSEKGIDLDSVDGGFITATGDVTGEITVVTTDSDKLATGTVIVKADDNVDVGDDVTIIDTENHIRIDDIGRGVDGNYSVGNSPLKGIKMNQYGQRNAVSGEHYNITEMYSPYTVDYSEMNLKTSVNYVGNIVVTPEWDTDYFVSVSASLTGTLADSTKAPSYPAKKIGEIVLDANGACSIPVGTYGYYSNITLTYVVQAKNPAQTVTYTFPVEVSQLETLAATEKQSNGYYSVPDATEYDNMTSFKFSNGGVDFQGRISGVNNGNWTNTTFSSNAWHYYLKINGVSKGQITITPSKDGSFATYSGNGIKLTVRAEVQMADGISYTTLIHQIDNPNGYRVSLGACSDTEILNADDVPIVETNYGYYLYGPGSTRYNCRDKVDMILVMYLKNSTGVDDVTGLWYGNYDGNTYVNHVWDSAPYTGTITDSAAAFHWDDMTGTSITKTIRMALRKTID